jgi:hypothetical protein
MFSFGIYTNPALSSVSMPTEEGFDAAEAQAARASPESWSWRRTRCGKKVGLQVDFIARLAEAQRGVVPGRRYEADGEAGGGEVDDRKRNAVDGDAALLDDQGRELGRSSTASSMSERPFNGDQGRYAIHMPWTIWPRGRSPKAKARSS